jgi:hypothetical protein
MAAMFAASLQQDRPPALVAEKIREIIESNSWKFRHPVGPDAEQFMQQRAAMPDEDWIDLGAADEETWERAMAERQARATHS